MLPVVNFVISTNIHSSVSERADRGLAPCQELPWHRINADGKEAPKQLATL